LNIAIFDAMNSQGKPLDLGLSPIEVCGESATGPFNKKLVCVDIEGLPLDIRLNSLSEVEASVDFYVNHITTLRSNNPDNLFGFYGIGPIKDYWNTVLEPAGYLELWQEANDVISRIVDVQDVVFPSLYTFYEDQAGWRKHAIANILEAKRISKGKPIFPFIFNAFHPSAPLAGTDLEYDYFYMEMNYIKYLRADGVVLWNGYANTWSEDYGWCRAIRKFIADQS